MSNGWVVFAYIIVYGFMAGYSVFLMMKLRSVRGRVES
jgi:fructose-specific phosphotransferase system IIC component